MNKRLAEHLQNELSDDKITTEEIEANWGVGLLGQNLPLQYLCDILNKEYSVDEAIADLKSFRGGKYDKREVKSL